MMLIYGITTLFHFFILFIVIVVVVVIYSTITPVIVQDSLINKRAEVSLMVGIGMKLNLPEFLPDDLV